jgi:5-methylcytosine-specific restriction endonuclease McrA
MPIQGKIIAYFVREINCEGHPASPWEFYSHGELGKIVVDKDQAIEMAKRKAKASANCGNKTTVFVVPVTNGYGVNENRFYKPEDGSLVFGSPIAIIDSETMKDANTKSVILLEGTSSGYHDPNAKGEWHYVEAKREYPAGFYTGRMITDKKGKPIPETTRLLSEAKVYDNSDEAEAEGKYGFEDDVWGNLPGDRFSVLGADEGAQEHLDKRYPAPRKGFNPKMRELIYWKYGGHCAYCGKKIPITAMQVDHLVAYMEHKGTDDISNLMPACSDCNRVKSNMTLDQFRDVIADEPRVMDDSQNYDAYKISKAYGLVKTVRKPVVFYFEKAEAKFKK